MERELVSLWFGFMKRMNEQPITCKWVMRSTVSGERLGECTYICMV